MTHTDTHAIDWTNVRRLPDDTLITEIPSVNRPSIGYFTDAGELYYEVAVNGLHLQKLQKDVSDYLSEALATEVAAPPGRTTTDLFRRGS